MVKNGIGGTNTQTGIIFEQQIDLITPEYKDVLDYIHTVKCYYYFQYLPLNRLGLPIPNER